MALVVATPSHFSAAIMVFENIEQMKRDLTDKYVLVDGSLPELRRFVGLTGTVKTVNYSGRALVQFDGNNNIGWFDIDPKFLKIIDAPLPKPVKEEKAEKKAPPAAKAEKPAADKPAAEKPAAKPASGGASVADILAAARGGAKPAAAPAAAGGKPSTADILAAARAKSGATSAAPKAEVTTEKPAAEKSSLSNKSSTADILAALRGKTAAPVAPKEVPAPKAEAAPKKEAVTPTPAAKVEAPATKPAVAAAKPAASPGSLPKDTAGIVAYCRKTDGK